MNTRRILTLMALWAGACGDDVADPSGGAGAGAGGAGSGGGVGDCGSSLLCLDVDGEWQDGAVVAAIWVRKEEQKLVDPVVGFAQPFDAAGPTVTIPLELVSEPPDHVLNCERACEDPMTCACEPGLAVGVALIVVVADDGTGGVDLVAYNDGDAQGYANAVIVFSEEAQPSTPPTFEWDFPQGVAQGMTLYSLTPDGGLEPSEAGARYELIPISDL